MNNREIILKNYNNPFHRGLTNDNRYNKFKVINSNCSDELDIMLFEEDEKIKNIFFDGEACVIAISSTSILLKLIIDKTKEEVLNIISEYEKLLDNKKFNKDLIGDLIVFKEIYKTPNRKKCASLAATAIKKQLLK